MKDDSRYILWRKIKSAALSGLFFAMRIFPIKKGKIVFASFEGDGGYCCNPRYIAEELLRRGKDRELVWLLHDTTKNFPAGIVPVKDTVWNVAYHLSTAEVWVDNYRKPYGTRKRDGQLYIQTWHASMGFKAVGEFRGELFPRIARLVSEADSKLIDYVISNSDYCTGIYPKKLLYNGPVIKSGSPRCDPIIVDREMIHRKIRSEKRLPEKCRIVMYAPTFRGGTQKKKKEVFVAMPSIDLERLITIFERTFGGDWFVFLRLHPQLSAKLRSMPVSQQSDRLIDVSRDDDMSELLAASDALMTDYSSCAFDAAFAMIPVFIYADDIDRYVKDRGRFMWRWEDLPFSIAEDNDSLEKNIAAFDEKSYRTEVKAFMKRHGVTEDGHASGRVADVIESFIGH